MLRLTKDTLAELTAGELASVVGGPNAYSTCLTVSCPTQTIVEVVVIIKATENC